MEDIDKFELIIDKALTRAEKLGVSDASIAYVLMRHGMGYFLKAFVVNKVKEESDGDTY